MIELSLLADEDQVEWLSDALLDELGALSVSVEDADADTASERALFGEPGMPAPRAGWQRSTLKALFADEAKANEAISLLLASQQSIDPNAPSDSSNSADQVTGALRGLKVLALREIEDQDWVRLTQSQFAPVEITPTFWIVPTWHEPPPAATSVIRLDPGLAFGTGTHPTTRMCLRWIATRPAEQREAWERVLDYGCGSGILAIGAALHGARHIDAVDIDPAAVESTRLNAAANGVTLNAALPDGLAQTLSGRLAEVSDHWSDDDAELAGTQVRREPEAARQDTGEATCGSASGTGRAATGSPTHATGMAPYQLVLANILATPLKLLAPLLCAHVAAGGSLVLAGILARQADELKEAYAPWCKLDVADEVDGWILMTARC